MGYEDREQMSHDVALAYVLTRGAPAADMITYACKITQLDRTTLLPATWGWGHPVTSGSCFPVTAKRDPAGSQYWSRLEGGVSEWKGRPETPSALKLETGSLKHVTCLVLTLR